MLDKLHALKVFCITADTMQFKETANRLAVSPPVVTRTIAELEQYLGEALFHRNTRQIELTDFGHQFLPLAQRYLAEGEKLFATKKQKLDEMKGIVRIAMPEMPFNHLILRELLTALSDYPDITLDWQVGAKRLNVVESQIDLGVRVGFPNDSRLIVRKIGTVSERIVATPELMARFEMPQKLQDLSKNYPLVGVLDENTGRYWAWQVNENEQFFPTQPAFISSDIQSSLQAVLSGVAIGHCLDWLCQPYLKSGELVELLPDIEKMQWAVYLYRPQRNVTPARVNLVFDLLKNILTNYL